MARRKANSMNGPHYIGYDRCYHCSQECKKPMDQQPAIGNCPSAYKFDTFRYAQTDSAGMHIAKAMMRGSPIR